MLFRPAHDSMTMMQMVVNDVLLQSEFGIRGVRPVRSR